tara:strand:+ start:369 stop:878 length:510 start_codon:yes stop_codon:yes gene_type:complete
MGRIKLESKRFLSMKAFVLILLLLQACSSDQIGKQLASNFEDPQDSPSIDRSENESNKELSLSKKNKDKTEKKEGRENLKKNKESKAALAMKNKNSREVVKTNSLEVSSFKKGFTSFKPKPYRIIIKLFGANPSAPAEIVTNVLRKAGIEFEVEKIERVNLQSNTSSSK